MTDAIGYLLIVLLLFGFPVFLLGYGIYVALTRGIRPQPEDQAGGPAMSSDESKPRDSEAA